MCSSSNSSPSCLGENRSSDWPRMRNPSRWLTNVCSVKGLPEKSVKTPPRSVLEWTWYSPHITGGASTSSSSVFSSGFLVESCATDKVEKVSETTTANVALLSSDTARPLCRRSAELIGTPPLSKEDRAGVRAMDLCVAHSAGLVFLCLVMESRNRGSRRIDREGVALKAKRIHVGALQQPRVGGSVRSVTRYAAFHFAGRMLEHERPRFF